MEMQSNTTSVYPLDIFTQEGLMKGDGEVQKRILMYFVLQRFNNKNPIKPKNKGPHNKCFDNFMVPCVKHHAPSPLDVEPLCIYGSNNMKQTKE